MSFGLVTCLNVEDVPKMLQNASRNYRGSQNRDHPEIWILIADRVDAFALQLRDEIAEAKKAAPKPPRRRVELR